jgi:hypothetical protein
MRTGLDGPVHVRARMAERAGFEPAVLSHTAFRERHHQPLGHLSAGEDTKPTRDDRRGGLRSAQRRGVQQGFGLIAADATDDLEPSRERGMLGELDDRPGRSVPVVRHGEDDRFDVRLQ